MYSAPPNASTRKEDEREENTATVEAETETESADEQITPGTDTNWTGAVPADD
ncbi:hypothetical protein [Haladaptatus sp. DFWS20]|uniref:hypothetical protein n=1 Tax=Haladaptatus sp. DFWS20 TaxID=3403467 RepID=UPI003EB6CEB2